jgi:hypothetical protein
VPGSAVDQTARPINGVTAWFATSVNANEREASQASR